MKQLAVLICISHIFFPSKKKNKELRGAFEGFWLFDQMLNGNNSELNLRPGNVILNGSNNKNQYTGIWISENRDESGFTWSINENGSVFTIKPEQTAVKNQATDSLDSYKGSYKIQSLNDTYVILQKAKMIIKFKRYTN